MRKKSLLVTTLGLGLSTACSGDTPTPSETAASGGARTDAAVEGAGGMSAGGAAAVGSGGGGAASGGNGASGAPTVGSGGMTGGDSSAGASAGGGAAGLDGGSALTDAGSDGASSGGAPAVDAGGPPNGTATIVAVGYAGLRVASYDLGRSWTHKHTLSDVAADDPNNLRGVTYGAGLFVAVGHKLFTSVDGDEWTRRAHPNDDAQWLGDVEYGNGRFVATGGYGYTAWSSDGLDWNEGDFLDGEASRSLAFGNGEFVTQTDPGNWYRSTDGATWTLHSSGHDERVAFCDGDFREAPECGPATGHGVFVRSGGWESGRIEWSEDASQWTAVTVGYPGGINGFAFGYAP